MIAGIGPNNRKRITAKINVKNVVSDTIGRMPISNVAISGIAFFACLSCFTASPKLLSVIIIAGSMSLPIMPANTPRRSAIILPMNPPFWRIMLNKIPTIMNTTE